MARNRSYQRGAVDVAQFQALAGLMGLIPPAPAAAPKREPRTELMAAVLSVHEIGLLIQAIETDANVPFTVDENDPGRRATKVNILDDVNAAKFRGRYQVVRQLTSRTAPKQSPEQEEIARLRAELAAAKAGVSEVAAE